MAENNSGEKTEQPTQRKIEKAREEGNVPKSMEISGITTIIIGFIVIYFCFLWWIDGIGNLYRYYINLFSIDMSRGLVVDISIKSILEVIKLMSPILLAILIAGVLGNISQFGFLFSPKAIKPKISKLNPITGLKNIFSLKKLVDGVLITTKVFASFIIGGVMLYFFIHELPTIVMLPFSYQLNWFGKRLLIFVAILILFYLVLSICDLVVKRKQYTKSLKMSKQEVKDEFKQMEGSPEVRKRIRSIMMQSAANRMMQNIPEADVVITNPTHYAVALRYDVKKERSPRVVAKGADYLALKIKEIAREHLIQIYESKDLAKDLYKSVDLDKEIPERLFVAVAKVLTYVHQANAMRN